MKYQLENWSIIADEWSAPELGKMYLFGTRTEDSKPVRTSRIVSVNGKEITTNSGSIYVLGVPDKEYLEWLKEKKIAFDELNPIKLKGYRQK